MIDKDKVIEALLAWIRMRDRIKLEGFEVTRVTRGGKFYIGVQAVFECKSVVDCEKLENAISFFFEHFEDLKRISPLDIVRVARR